MFYKCFQYHTESRGWKT